VSKNHMTKRLYFASGKGGHDVTEHFEGGCHVSCDKTPTTNQGWTKNTWTDCIGVRMSQGRIVTADGSLGSLSVNGSSRHRSSPFLFLCLLLLLLLSPCTYFLTGVGNNVTEHFEGGCHVSCDKTPTTN
jgi:hypothetical protein